VEEHDGVSFVELVPDGVVEIVSDVFWQKVLVR
jgi:hypothetical protein